MGKLYLSEESSAPATPATDVAVLYPKTSDSKLYWKDDTGTERTIQPGGWALIQRQSVSAVAQVDFTTGISSTYDLYMFSLIALIPATDNTDLWLRITKDGGSTWRSTAGDYKHCKNILSDAATNTPSGSTSDVKILACSACGNAAGESVDGTFILPNPASTTLKKSIFWQLGQNSSTPNSRFTTGSGLYTLDAGAINGVRFLMSSGNITSCVIALYGLKLT